LAICFANSSVSGFLALTINFIDLINPVIYAVKVKSLKVSQIGCISDFCFPILLALHNLKYKFSTLLL
jgi:hypothetical protein